MKPYYIPLPDPAQPHQITLQKGKLFLIDHDHLIMLTSPIILTNGIVVTLEGHMRMPNGKTRILSEGEYV